MVGRRRERERGGREGGGEEGRDNSMVIYRKENSKYPYSKLYYSIPLQPAKSKIER